ncbi:MAG: hypothetical protein JWP44_2253 [Mucilaginibacter sp.]|nr:hypothetical protein [Mucilaginibacter sp.]
MNAFETVKQVKQLGLVDATDLDIWNYASENDFTIITFDSDFIDLANLKGSPPKIIWLRSGNSSNLKIANKLLSKADVIKEFIMNSDAQVAF